MLAQFLTENLLLASVGAAAGLLLAFAGIKALLVISPAYLPRVAGVEIDVRVIAFVVVTTVLTALVFGLAPAMHAVAGNISDSLKEGGRGDTDGAQRNKLRSLLVGSEFALAFMLLIGAGLMVRSFYALQSVDPGFNPQNVVSMVVSVAGTAEEPGDKRVVFYRALLQKIRALPGVAAGGAINHLPLAGDFWSRSFEIEGRPKPRPGEAPDAVYRVVMPGYFETMRLPLKMGRLITDSDDARSPHVVIINERAAREHWPGKSPIGERIVIGGRTSDPPEWLTIVGVVADAKQSDWAEPPYPEIYIAGLQTPEFLGTDANSIAAHMNYLTPVARPQAGNPFV
jgi:putative ABC transport system permease protein